MASPKSERVVRLTLGVSLVALAMSLAGSTTLALDWSSYRGDSRLSGRAEGSLSDALELAWEFETGAAIVSSPVVADGRVYVGSDDGNLYAIDFATGEKVWAFETQDMIEAPPLVVDGMVYVGGTDFFFYALDAKTGELKWKHETDDKIVGSANVFRDGEPDGELGDEPGEARIVVGSYDNALYCFGAESGELLWVYETENYVNGTPALAGDKVIFGGCDSVLHVVDVRTGERSESVPMCAECHIAGSVAVHEGRVLFGHYGNAFVCVELATGETEWVFDESREAFFSSPAISDGKVVFGGRNKVLYCADVATGEVLWTKKTRRKIDGSAVICGDRVVFGSGDGRLYLLRLEDGAEVWTYEIGESIFSSPAVHEGHVLVGANDGVLYAFGPASVPAADAEQD